MSHTLHRVALSLAANCLKAEVAREPRAEGNTGSSRDDQMKGEKLLHILAPELCRELRKSVCLFVWSSVVTPVCYSAWQVLLHSRELMVVETPQTLSDSGP